MGRDRAYVDMDVIYQRGHVPWNRQDPPQSLVALVEGGIIPPGKVVDLGCGLGNYAMYLARKGFDVTGVDISPTAVQKAQEQAKRAGLACRFLVADVLGDLQEFAGQFDCAYDWELLHHIFPGDRQRYVRSVHTMLRHNGRYLSVCFSEEDPYFGGQGKYRRTSLGTLLYFSSEEELKDLFSPCFTILEMKPIEIEASPTAHRAISVFMEKR